jgi:hypothetical protein
MSLLTAEGAWIEPWGYLRAFSECYVVGCVLLALGPTRSRPDPLLVWAAVAVAAEVTFVNWEWCIDALP